MAGGGGELPARAGDFADIGGDVFFETHQLPVAGRMGEGEAGFTGEAEHGVVGAQRIAEQPVGAEGPTIAIRYMKDNLDEALMFDYATARDHEAERMIRSPVTSDHREAVAAFIEKRKPVFKGS